MIPDGRGVIVSEPSSLRKVVPRMARTHPARVSAAGLALLTMLVSAPALRAAEPSWRIDKGDVQVTVPLKPGGAFQATTTAVRGTATLAGVKPGHLTGEIAVDLSTIDTGIALRNQHLRENYLEVGKGAGFDKAVLSEIHLADVDKEGFQGSTAFTATLLLHGVKREVSGKADLRTEGAARRVRAEFPLTLTDFAVTPPEYLGVGVGSRLLVKVTLTATPSGEAATPAH
jgi:polyisoprenoid-binding protein YceI